ncbi:MAG: hypothetical protein WD595_04370 [Waddliaceae bacterium]
MTNIEKIDFSLLDENLKKSLIPQNVRLEDLDSKDLVCLLVDKDKALLIAEADSTYKTLYILSLESIDVKWIPPLLQEIETVSNQLDLNLILITYSSTHPHLQFLEENLKNHHWKGPRKQKIFCHFDRDEFHPPWYDRVPPPPNDYEEFLWKELKPEERTNLLRLVDQMAIPGDISPFSNEETILYDNSLGLRYQGEIIGWMVTHLLPSRQVQYSAFYIDKAHRHKAIAPRLLRDSIQLQKQSPFKWAVCEVNLLFADESWVRFVEKRLAPYTLRVHYNYQMWKNL